MNTLVDYDIKSHEYSKYYGCITVLGPHFPNDGHTFLPKERNPGYRLHCRLLCDLQELLVPISAIRPSQGRTHTLECSLGNNRIHYIISHSCPTSKFLNSQYNHLQLIQLTNFCFRGEFHNAFKRSR